MDKCPLCLHPQSRATGQTGDWMEYTCPTCWRFLIRSQLGIRTHALLANINNMSEEDVAGRREQLGPVADGIHLLSGTARLAEIEGREPRRFDMETAREAVREAPGDVVEKTDRLLLSLGVLAAANPGRDFDGSRENVALGFARDQAELSYLVQMLKEWGLLHAAISRTMTGDLDVTAFSLSADGWKRIRELRTAGAESIHGFVAMGFEEFRRCIYTEGIAPAIEANGYRPLRLDEDEYAGLIDERMLLQIQRSRFLVAEVTDVNLGVYFEAGYALGINKSVFFTCHQDCIGRQHFDISHYNHVLWEDKEDLREKLDRRIRFWIGSRVPRND